MAGKGEPKWDRIEADFRAGMGLGELCKKHKVTMAALLAKIKETGWTRASAGPKPAKSTMPVPAAAVVVDPVQIAVQEARADVIGSHKSISRQLRASFDMALAEFQEMTLYFATFKDENTIAALKDKIPLDSGEALAEFLKKALAAFKLKTDVLEKLTRIGTQIIDRERVVWGVADEDSSEQAQTFDDLLEQLQTPLAPRELPRNVVEFDRRMARNGS